ncbi:hypothetical protein NDU88_001633 [Pleurodeles waltl]|uniref:Uncharacterized protein n=1 Tax=Pleurodeles waltl TaxID=8319 RepID=A0AAV7MK95_PLEWA|nr:hypothetical protein NDU88_001633 [Pleurodeles waltl]
MAFSTYIATKKGNTKALEPVTRTQLLRKLDEIHGNAFSTVARPAKTHINLMFQKISGSPLESSATEEEALEGKTDANDDCMLDDVVRVSSVDDFNGEYSTNLMKLSGWLLVKVTMF